MQLLKYVITFKLCPTEKQGGFRGSYAGAQVGFKSDKEMAGWVLGMLWWGFAGRT